MKRLLLLLNGDPHKILESNRFSYDEFLIVKIDEKLLVNPKAIIKQIKSSDFVSVHFGCKENELQRFHIFMKIYILLSFIFDGSIIDETGHQNKVSLIKLLFYEVPRLCMEAVISIVVIIFFYIKIPVLKWTMMKKP